MRLVYLVLVLAVGSANANSLVEMGDGQIDGSKLKAYEITWRQCSLQGETWESGSDLTERLVSI